MNRKLKFLTVLLVIIFLVPLLKLDAIAYNLDNQIPEYAEGYLLVQFDLNLPEAAKQEHFKGLGLTRDEILTPYGLERIKINDNRPIHSVIAQLSHMPGVVFAEPDYVLYPTATPEDDTYYPLLWGLNNTGQTINGSTGDGETDIDAPEAWAIASENNLVTVAVIDTAVDRTHPDLQEVVTYSEKFHRGPSVYDHGTHVAGTIAALDNQIGVIGIAPNIEIYSLAFLGSNGGYTSDAVKAINRAIELKANIINASWGGGGYSLSLLDAIDRFEGPFVAAAGNSGVNTDNSPHYPSSYTLTNIVSVAAVNNRGQLASFSNYGSTSVDVGAPGVDIASTYPNGYAYMSGTSMAAPHVTGVLALMESYNNTFSAESLIEILYNSGKLLPSLSNKTSQGSLINAYNALLMMGSTPPTDTTPPELTSTTPEDGTMNVPLDTPIQVVFNEPVQLAIENNITINDQLATVIPNDNILTIISPETLTYSTLYSVNIPENTVTDQYGNPYVNPVLFEFTTIDEPPQPTGYILVQSTSPSEGETGISRGANIIIQLDQNFTNIDVTKIKLYNASGNQISFVASGEGTNELLINPDGKLSRLSVHTLVLEENALWNGTVISQYFVLTFTAGTK